MPLSSEMQPCNRQSSVGAAVSPSLSHHGMALHLQSKSSCPSFATHPLNLLVKLLVKLLIRVGLKNSIVFRNYLSDAETMPLYSEIKLAVYTHIQKLFSCDIQKLQRHIQKLQRRMQKLFCRIQNLI